MKASMFNSKVTRTNGRIKFLKKMTWKINYHGIQNTSILFGTITNYGFTYDFNSPMFVLKNQLIQKPY